MCCWVQVPVDSKEGIRSPVAGVTGLCEPPDVGSGNPTLVLWKSGTSS